MSIDDNVQYPYTKYINKSIFDLLISGNLKQFGDSINTFKPPGESPMDSVANKIIEEAPSFKDLLWAIMDEKRNNILNTEFYKFLEKRIKERCEEGARKLKSSITLIELDLHSSDIFFKNMSNNVTSSIILDTIKCICNKLELEFDVDTISWGRTSVSPKED